MILVYMEIRKIILNNYKNVLKRLNEISLNLENCAFCVNLAVLLRHIICHDDLLVDPHKITAITTMPTPTNPTKIKQLLRIIIFY
jgi:hypothetical protein